MLCEHGKCHVVGVSQTHVQPTSNIPTAPQASKKLDTPSTIHHNHDNCQLQHSPDTVQTDTAAEELFVTIPIHFKIENPENEDIAIDSNNLILQQPETVHQNPEEIKFPPEYFGNGQENGTSSYNDNEQDHDIIETENNQTPDAIQYSIINYERDINLQEDIDDGWIRVENNQLPDHCHFIGNEGLNMNTSHNPEDFFNNLFDDRMYTIFTEETNKYARQQIMKVMGNRGPFQHMNNYSYQKHARLGTWKDLNSSDIKIFIAHLLVMSSIRKPAVHNYWSTTSFSRTPFVGQYLGRNKFQDILWNLHVVADTSGNPPTGLHNHDPLAKVRPLVTMCQDNFKVICKPCENLSIDESTMAYKGQVKFLQYSKNKPNRFHIKLFMVSEADTGYICEFSMYTGRASNELLAHKSTLNPDCTITTKTVMGVLQKCHLLDSHWTLYFDNWFNSLELVHELRYV